MTKPFHIRGKSFFARRLPRDKHIEVRTKFFKEQLAFDHELQKAEAIKKCPGCKEILNLADFDISNSEKDGYQSRCRDCSKEGYLTRNKYSAQKEATCLGCNQTLSAEHFYINPIRKTGLTPKCRKCGPKRKEAFSEESIRKNREVQTKRLRN